MTKWTVRNRVAKFNFCDFVNPSILRLHSVGSRDVEADIERLRNLGRQIIDVRGYPHLKLPEHLIQAAERASRESIIPPSDGLLSLREALSDAICAQYHQRVDPEREILVTSGGMHALHVTFTALLQPKDEVLVASPCYFFGGLVEMAGARPVYVEMAESGNYALDFDKIRRHISPKTKAIVLNSPVNPTGYVYSRDDVEHFIDLAEEHNLLLLSDESYDRAVFDGLEHVSPFTDQRGRKRTILIKSFTKSYALPAWRIGYIAANANLVRCFQKVLEWNLLYCSYVNQRVALAALTGRQDWLVRIFRDLELRRNQILAGLRGLETLFCSRPRGGPFVFLNVSRQSSDCVRFARKLIHDFGVPAVPGVYFGSRKHVRIPFWGSQGSVAKLVSALGEANNLKSPN